MSLLMEALRKAEAHQRQLQEEKARLAASQNIEATTSPAQSPEPQPQVPEPLPRQPEPPILDLQIQRVTLAEPDIEPVQRATQEELRDYLSRPPQDLDDIAPLPPRPSTLTSLAATPAPVADRQSAATVFSAKAGKPRVETSTKTRTIALAALALLMVPLWFVMMWYFNQQGSSSLELDPAIANYDLSGRGYLDGNSAATAAGVITMPIPDAQLPTVPEPAPSLAETPLAETPLASAKPQITASETEAAVVPTSIPALPAEPAAISDEVIAEAPSQNLEIKRSTNRNTVDPRLRDAYALFRAGDSAGAAQHYQAVISAAPDNRDALLGLAAIALQQQDPTQARAYYTRLLDLNPQDHLARAGLMQSIGSLAPAEKESTLRSMLAAVPDSAPLHFALGNFYAEQQRWPDAQAAYFNALLQARRATEGAINPDYAFNLAISLERLGQRKAALEYYREAQNLARKMRGSFDSALLDQRLATLERLLP